MARPKITREGTEIPGVRKVVRSYEDGRRTTKYEVRVKDALGNLRNVGTYDDKDDARRASVQARADVQNGAYVSRSAGAVRFIDVAESWLASPRVQGLKPSTRYGYTRILGSYLAPFHRVQVNRLGYAECSSLIGQVMAGRAPSTVGHILHVLRCVLDHAVKSGYLRTNPAREVAKPKLRAKREIVVLQPTDVERILAAMPDARHQPDRWRLLAELAVESGCRAGELTGLRVRCLDTVARRLTVETTVLELNGEVHVGTPKSAAGLRVVDGLNPDLCHRLAAHVAGMAPDDYVFGDGVKPLRHNNWNNRIWRPTVEALGLTGVRFHDLRHYHASAYLLLTGDAVRTAKRLGHADPSVTLKVYGHVLEHQGSDVSGAFAALRAEGRSQLAATEPTPAEPPVSATAGGVVDLAAYRKRRAG